MCVACEEGCRIGQYDATINLKRSGYEVVRDRSCKVTMGFWVCLSSPLLIFNLSGCGSLGCCTFKLTSAQVVYWAFYNYLLVILFFGTRNNDESTFDDHAGKCTIEPFSRSTTLKTFWEESLLTCECGPLVTNYECKSVRQTMTASNF